jgi:exopolyphosphatase / guanosine-5'-triphosphate,3'-diphosphate pyrophosphatase
MTPRLRPPLQKRIPRGGWKPVPDRLAAFPLRLACVDVGSNGIRFLAVKFTGPNRWQVLESGRAAVRLGRGAFRANRLEPGAMAAALQALARFRRRMQVLDIRHYRLVATSAVRESANGQAFVQRVKKRLGLDLEVISGTEEARLVVRAVKSRLALGRRAWLVVNVGGGSVEVAQVDQRGVIWSQSHTMGAVRLLQELTAVRGQTASDSRRRLADYVAALRFSHAPNVRPAAGLIATGGNIEELARLAKAPVRRNGTAVLSLAALRRVTEELAALSVPARRRRLRLKKDRADVILPAAVVYERLCVLAGKQSLLVPFVGTKEGIVLDLADNLTAHRAYAKEKETQLLSAAVALGRRYHYDEAHSLQVARLALSLFEQLRELHRLGEADYRILLAAAVLHDIGAYISYKKHHKHSLYLLSQSELPGLNQEEMLMVANVARYHRKGSPGPAHEYFVRLSKPDRDRVAKLAALLRLADALDREHAQNVRRLQATLQPRWLTLEVAGEGDADSAAWAVKRKAQLFGEVFGRKVRVSHNV